MEGLIILVIWALINAFIKDANRKNREGKSKTIAGQEKRKNVFSTLMEELEKEMQGQKEKQRSEGPVQWSQPSQSARPSQPARPARPPQPTMVSDRPARPPQPEAPPKPVGLEIDAIGGDEEIGGIKEAGIYKGSNLDLDIKRDFLKGIIYSEILAKPKSLRKRNC